MKRIWVVATCAVALAFLLGASPVGDAAQRLVIPANSVGTAQLKNNAVTATKVKAGTLTARHFRPGQLPRGAAGPAGPAGPPGAAGPPGTSAWQFVGAESGFDSSSPKTATANCPVGKRAISWAFRIELTTTANPDSSPGLTEMTPLDVNVAGGTLPGGYTAKAQEFGSYPDSWKLFVYATCATI